MAMTADHYFSQQVALLPRGLLWDSLVENELGDVLRAQAEEYSRIDARTDTLLKEADPRTTYEMLPEWESDFGLPDPCLTEELTIEQRNKVLHTKVTNTGGQSRQFFIDLAKGLGYNITITEFSIFNFESGFEDPMTDEAWLFTWQVNAAAVTINYMTFESGLDEAYATWGNERLECAINRLKPDHTTVQFAYGE